VLTAKHCNQTTSKQHQDAQWYHKWLWKHHMLRSCQLPKCSGVTYRKLSSEKMLSVIIIIMCSVGCTKCHKTK
jgi:hypothetical protein